ncbi:MAG TPA: HNH endonuclease [Acidobacteriota bacterium]|nr:HNH endonuclease [Acidobacteriota bacterium]
MMELDRSIRLAAFDWLSQQEKLYGESLPRDLLMKGFRWRDSRIPLVSPQGIFKPKQLELPLTITTAPNGPYNDTFLEEGGALGYRYRGSDPFHRDNVGLRTCMQKGIPLIYFYGVMPGIYVAVWPVLIVGDEPQRLTFRIQVDDPHKLVNRSREGEWLVSEEDSAVRRYITVATRHRLHQTAFREKVLQAYRRQCTLCRLRHQELLDAAHIIEDSSPAGEPRVQNGLALCKIHHAAFDRHIIGITPDYVVEVRLDILEEIDGPMLEHGLQGLHRKGLHLPYTRKLYPDRDLLAWRYEEFRKII